MSDARNERISRNVRVPAGS